MKARRVEACCVLSADGKSHPGGRGSPPAVRDWLRELRRGCKLVRPARTARLGTLAAAIRHAPEGRIVVEGTADVLHALAGAGLLTHIHAAILPVVTGGAGAPTLFGPASRSLLLSSVGLRLQRFRTADGAALASYVVLPGKKSASARGRRPLQNRP